MATLLHVSGLCRSYGDKEVLFDVTFTLVSGERLVVLGHNGAGKSTLLELVGTLREPTRGRVVVGGFDVRSEVREARRLIGVTPQSNALDPSATPREIMQFQSRALGMRPREAGARTDALLAQFGLNAHAQQRIAKLSGGTRRKVDLAVALMGSPRLLVLDEPTTGLDPVARQEFHAALRTLSDSGTALLISTQDLHEAERLATRILVLRQGRMVADDTPAQLKSAVGERLLIVQGKDPDRLAAALSDSPPAHTAPMAIRRIDRGVQLSVGADSQSLATVLRSLESHAHLIDHMSLAPPSLDDVFLAMAIG